MFVSDTIAWRDAGNGLFTIAAVGTGITLVKKDSLYDAIGDYAVWSPAGTLIAIYSCGQCRSYSGGTVAIQDLDQGWGRGIWGGGYPSWSSDGTMLAAVKYGQESDHVGPRAILTDAFPVKLLSKFYYSNIDRPAPIAFFSDYKVAEKWLNKFRSN